MRSSIRAAIVSLSLIPLIAGPALAQNPHFVGPIQTLDQGTTLLVSGSIAGLGNENIDVVVLATGIATVQCRNPGGNIAPGQDTTVTGTGTGTNIEVKNGRANFSVPTTSPTVGSDACPNARWTPEVLDVQFTSVTINVYQPSGSGNLVLTNTINF